MIACLEAGFVYWYAGVVVSFTTLTCETETVQTERPEETTLNTLWPTFGEHSLK